ncbi:unnamed protein product [Linum trigynum]|uniref:Uncharacterized protein n=1 Tax=Linum trigynum TaxID=586398 RepID=A0AAV2CVN4_9ROSI
MDAGHQEAFDILLNAGIQAELILGTIARRANENNSNSNGDYLEDRVSFSEDKLLDSHNKGVMMAWEKPLMEAHAKDHGEEPAFLVPPSHFLFPRESGSGSGGYSREIEGKSLWRRQKQGIEEEEEGWMGHGFDFWVG